MKVLFLSNNDNARKLYEWLEKRCDILFFDKKIDIEMINFTAPSIIVSYNYKYLISEKVIELCEERDIPILNLHISFLPWNKGSNPNFWSFVEDTPKGVTIHRISPKLDEGAIIYRKELVFDRATETFASTYQKLNDEIVQLFVENWEEIKEKKYTEILQETGGSYHNMKDFKMITEKCPIDWTENIDEYLKKLRNVV